MDDCEGSLSSELLPRIPEFYAGRSVFITGATGFIGKVLVEKLLRSCPDIDTIYLLMRPKKGQDVTDRIKDITNVPLFDRVKKEQPKALDKLRAIPGDVSELELGMSAGDWKFLQERVSVVIHMAASVRFDDPIKKAVFMNVRGTREVVRLASGMKNLQILAHTSTTYCNTSQKEIEERIYEAPADWRTVIDMAESVDPYHLRILTKKFLGVHPNTYTFTKALAEHVINDYRDQLPVVILRPSIVVPTWFEPVPGWIDNFNGPIGLMAGAGKGIVHIVYCNKDVSLDFVPVDIVAKGIIIASWLEALQRTRSMPVYNCSNNELKRMNVGTIPELAIKLKHEVPLNNVLYNPFGGVTDNFTIFYVLFVLSHLLPAFLVDAVLWMASRQTALTKIQRRIYNAIVALEFFTFHDWPFENFKFLRLEKALRPEDFENFSYHIPEVIDEIEFFVNAMWGARRYLLKEEDKDLPAAHRHLNRMAVLHYVLTSLFFGSLVWFTYRCVTPWLF